MSYKGFLLVLLSAAVMSSAEAGFYSQMRRLLQTADPVEQVLEFARNAAQVSIENAESLLETLRSGDMAASRQAYLKLRPEYEQIEHLYEVFGDTDADIDARPDAFTYGEAIDPNQLTTPGAIFKGSHRIEVLLYRDENVTAAIPFAELLIEDYKTLLTKLENAEDYTEEIIFAGLIEVAYEVAKKKFSSEEETWSDQSVLIFDNNLKGIIEMVKPFQSDLETTDTAVAQELQANLDAATAALAPFIESSADGNTYTPYSTVPMEARKAIQEEFYNVALSLEAAAEALNYARAAEAEAEAESEAGADEDTCTPTITLAEYNSSTPYVQNGIDYFRALLPYQQNFSAEFTKLVEAGDLDAVKAAYGATRPLWEQIEVLAVSYPFIDEDLDAREYVYPKGELSEMWKGFHRLERLIFRDGTLDNETLQYAKGVEESLVELDTLYSDELYSANFAGVLSFEGMMNLANEVASKKVSSEEETSSDLSMMIFYNNWKGILSQALPFCPLAEAECAELVAAVKEAGECIGITTDSIEKATAADVTAASVEGVTEAEYPLYSEASMADRKCVVEKGYAVRDAVVKMANALNLVSDCSPFYSDNFVTYPMGEAKVVASSTEEAAASTEEAAATTSAGLKSMGNAVVVAASLAGFALLV
ncbi:hypothetical protein Ndes2526B_g00663 [Nannochloris sp. 'desiccata']